MNIHRIASILIGLPFIWIGITHFTNTAWFEPIVPEILGDARFWVLASGVFEILFGITIMIPKFTKITAIGMVSMLVVLYWANLNMWINDISLGDTNLSNVEHIIRAFIQLILILTILWVGKLPPFNQESYFLKKGSED